MRVAPAVDLTEAQSIQLQAWARGRKTPARLVRRAQIVLLAAEGKQNKEIGRLLCVMPRIVSCGGADFSIRAWLGWRRTRPGLGASPR